MKDLGQGVGCKWAYQIWDKTISLEIIQEESIRDCNLLQKRKVYQNQRYDHGGSSIEGKAIKKIEDILKISSKDGK